jgi:hypothetical protein
MMMSNGTGRFHGDDPSTCSVDDIDQPVWRMGHLDFLFVKSKTSKLFNAHPTCSCFKAHPRDTQVCVKVLSAFFFFLNSFKVTSQRKPTETGFHVQHMSFI